MSEIEDIIARLEKATGPDRKCDKLIHREISKRLVADETFIEYLGPGGTTRTLTFAYPYRFALWCCPSYTASVEAALTLVPGGVTLDLRRCDDGSTGYAMIRASDMTPDDADDELYVEAPMCTAGLPVAICIAALKARFALTHLERSGEA